LRISFEDKHGIFERGLRAGSRGEVIVCLFQGLGIIVLQIDREARIGGSGLLTGGGILRDEGPLGEVLVAAPEWCDDERTDIVKRLRVGLVDYMSFLDQVQNDYRLLYKLECIPD
jgi:hypothetical protein